MPIWAAPTATCARANALFNCCIRCRAGPAAPKSPAWCCCRPAIPNDAVMQALARGDRDGFYAQEREFRVATQARRPSAAWPRSWYRGYDGELVREIARQLGKAAPRCQAT